MATTSSPAVWRRWLALELKRLRQEAGLSQAEVAQALHCRVPKISLTESAQRNVQLNDLETLLELYEVPPALADDYRKAAEGARRKGWWEHYDPHTLPEWFGLFVGLEQGAERMRTYQPALFHGLLQIPEYTAAAFRASSLTISEERIDRMVELRTHRQEAFTRQNDPLVVWLLMDEAVLRRIVGGPKIMRAQLEHVLDVADRYPHVTLQVIPFDRGATDANYGPFTILSFPWRTDDGVVYVETRSGAVYLETLADIDMHSQVFEHLSTLALSEADSLELLAEAAAAHEQ